MGFLSAAAGRKVGIMTGSCQALTGPVSLAGASGSSIGLKFIFLPAAVSFVEAIPVNPIHEYNPYLLSAHQAHRLPFEEPAGRVSPEASSFGQGAGLGAV